MSVFELATMFGKGDPRHWSWTKPVNRKHFGMGDLLKRQPGIVETLLADAPALMPIPLEGPLWRFRVTEYGQRRVNYHIKHMLQNTGGEFGKPLVDCEVATPLYRMSPRRRGAFLSCLARGRR